MKHIKKYKIFESCNKTENIDEEKLIKYFGITSQEIQDWIQDILDDDTNLDFYVVPSGDKQFWITFHYPNHSKLDYKIPEETLTFLNSQLREFGLHLPTEVYYYDYYFTICVEPINYRDTIKENNHIYKIVDKETKEEVMDLFHGYFEELDFEEVDFINNKKFNLYLRSDFDDAIILYLTIVSKDIDRFNQIYPEFVNQLNSINMMVVMGQKLHIPHHYVQFSLSIEAKVEPVKENLTNDKDEIEAEIESFILNMKDEIVEEVNTGILPFTRKSTGCQGFTIMLNGNNVDVSNCRQSIFHLIEYMYSIGYGLNNMSESTNSKQYSLIWSSGRKFSDPKPFPQDMNIISERLEGISKLNRLHMEFEN